MSAIIYSLRCLVDMEIPLNQGCLNPIRVIVPDGTLLSPTPTAAVVGGNVLTSQRVTDVVLSAFGACACSQGCMNNLTFGDNSMVRTHTALSRVRRRRECRKLTHIHRHCHCAPPTR